MTELWRMYAASPQILYLLSDFFRLILQCKANGSTEEVFYGCHH